MPASDFHRVSGAAVLVPVKAFADAKVRLASSLDPAARAELARSMAAGVLAAAAPLPVWVACDDEGVADWATARHAAVVWTPGLGLNGAVQHGVDHLRQMGATEVIVAHADLPLASGLATLTGFDGVTLVPDRRDDGTNVICVPTSSPFAFSYGPGSFERHISVSHAAGLATRIVRSSDLAWDIDVPADLDDFAARP